MEFLFNITGQFFPFCQESGKLKTLIIARLKRHRFAKANVI